MTDRLLVYSDPKMIKLISENFIPVADNDWYSRRRQDAVGEFFRRVANQGPRKGEGGRTRQGAYIFTADGKLLAYNNNRSLEKRMGMIKEALGKWSDLPEEQRKPGGVKVQDLGAGKLDKKYVRTPPENGLILETFTRALVRGEDGDYTRWKSDSTNRQGTLAARDRVWIKENEWKSLLAEGDAASTENGVDVPERIAMRLFRFHLVDSTRGEPPMWKPEEVKRGDLKIYRSGMPGEYRISGSARMEAGEDRGYDVSLSGKIVADPVSKRASRFELLALGEHWGEGPFTRGAREGKTPLAVYMRLAKEDSPGRDVPPQACSWEQGYYEAER